MAHLLKQNARKPVVMDAAALGSQCFTKGEIGYLIEVIPKVRSERPYVVHLTRAEMLGVVASWLHAEARSAIEAAKLART